MGNKDDKVVVALSGGLDSAVLATMLHHQGYEVHAVSVNYGQRHSREIAYATALCTRYNWPHTKVDMSAIGRQILRGSALTSALDTNPETPTIPDGHYTDGNMKITVVPNRNMLLLSILGAKAASMDAQAVAYGAHAGDHVIYPDCRKPFVAAMRKALSLCHFKPIELLTPFVDKMKCEVVRIGAKYDVDFRRTWSCYKGGDDHCGRCATCFERREAFVDGGVSDPTVYTDKTPFDFLKQEFLTLAEEHRKAGD